MSNKVSILNLFESVKTFGNYTKTNGIDNKIYLEDLLKFIKNLNDNDLNNFFNNIKWNMNLKINEKNENDLNKIYNYVYNVLNIKGEKHDDNTQNHDDWMKKHIFLRLFSIPNTNPKVKLVNILHIAFYLGELMGELKKNNSAYSEKALNFLQLNNLFELTTYINLTKKEEEQIASNKNIQNIFNLILKYLICIMNQIQLNQNSTKNNKQRILYKEDVETFTKENNAYRNVIYTGPNQQFVLMSIKPNDDIKLEIHDKNDQYIKVVEGSGYALVNNEKFDITNKSILIIPAGTPHYIKNTGSIDLKLYSIYSPKEHPENLIQNVNPDKSNNVDKKNDIDIIIGGNIKKKDYEMKYLHYKNKYLTIKKFMKKFHY